MLPNPMPYFENLSDPRRETRNKLHKLIDIVMIVFCATLSGIEDWVGMEDFAQEKEAWFRGFLELANGIPSHDTLSDVIGRINPKEFNQAFLAWVKAGLPGLADEHVCVDGKALRGSQGDTPIVRTGLAAVGCVESTRIIGEKTSVETRYYLCSFTDFKRFAEGVRTHWLIENSQHWVLDVQFGEDSHRTRKDYSVENLALIRRAALNLFNTQKQAKESIRRRKLRACLSDCSCFELLFGKQRT